VNAGIVAIIPTLHALTDQFVPACRRSTYPCRRSRARSHWVSLFNPPTFFDSLQALGLKLGAIALCALPVATGWLVLSMALGRIQERRAEQLGKAVQGD